MKTLEQQLDEILNSELMNHIIEQEDKDLKEAGWTYDEVQSFAKGIIKASKQGLIFKQQNRKKMIQITLGELFGLMLMMGGIGLLCGLSIAVMKKRDDLKAKANERIR